MHRKQARTFGVLLLAAMCATVGCSSVGPSDPTTSRLDVRMPAMKESTRTPIRHVVIMVQENRSFDNLFATFPGADGTTTGRTPTGTVRLKKSNLAGPYGDDLGHGYASFLADYDDGKLDGWVSAHPAENPYQYVDPHQIRPYWALAKQYVLADHFFTTEKTASWPAHQDIIAGSAQISAKATEINTPSATPWGCDAPTGTFTAVLTSRLKVRTGPYPCFDRVTLADLLDAKHVSWKYYVEAWGTGNIWNGFRAIRSVYQGPEWGANISSPETNVLNDIAGGELPAVAWVMPTGYDSDHPGISKTDTGPEWVAAVVNAIGTSQYWNSTAVVVVWDDWGGLYDHVPPPQLDYKGLGFRVPMLVISPYVRSGQISHTQYEFGSILKFVEGNWVLGSLGTTDVRANSIRDAFDFKLAPRRFVKIRAGSYLPPDADSDATTVPLDGD